VSNEDIIIGTLSFCIAGLLLAGTIGLFVLGFKEFLSWIL